MSEGKAKALILANGYLVIMNEPGRVKVLEQRGRRADRIWTGVSWRDLASSFKLHVRKAGQ